MLTRKLDLPLRESVKKEWSRSGISSIRRHINAVTKKWSVFVWFSAFSLLATFILEFAGRTSALWYYIVVTVVICTALLESPLGRVVEVREEKKRKETPK